jgi:hypothetical protein
MKTSKSAAAVKDTYTVFICALKQNVTFGHDRLPPSAPVHSNRAPRHFRDIREQHIHEGVLAIERRTSLIFGRNDSLNCSDVALTERVVLRAKETFTPSVARTREPTGP